MKKIIKDAWVISPENHLNGNYHILIENDKIQKVISAETQDTSQLAIIDSMQSDSQVEVIEAKDTLLIPGLIDLHVHLREPGFEYKETIYTGSRACAKGGYTTVACMPNTKPALDSVDHLNMLKDIIRKDSLIDIRPIGAITHNIAGESLTDHQALLEAGALALSDDGHTTMNPDYMIKAFEASRQFNRPVITHSEDHTITEQYQDEIYPIEAEYKIVERDVELCRISQGILHVAHVSGHQALESIRKGKASGVEVTCEVAPHHFALNNTIIDTHVASAKVNPPIRTPKEQEALIEGIRSGLVDIIATDHAPHDKKSKAQDYAKAAYGISGIESAWQISYTKLVLEEKIPLEHMIAMMTSQPAKIGRLEKVGCIQEGYYANLTFIDLESESIIDPDNFISKGKNSPFKGYPVKSQVIRTMYRGETVYFEGGQL